MRDEANATRSRKLRGNKKTSRNWNNLEGRRKEKKKQTKKKKKKRKETVRAEGIVWQGAGFEVALMAHSI